MNQISQQIATDFLHTVEEHLLEAATWLENHEWTTGANWRDEMGKEVDEERDRVEMACMMGAVFIVEDEERTPLCTQAALTVLADYLQVDSLMEFNDKVAGHKKVVVSMLREAARFRTRRDA